MRSYCRLLSSSSFSGTSKLEFDNNWNVKADTSLHFLLPTTKKISVSKSGAMLHGIWQSDLMITTRDRYKKENLYFFSMATV